MTPHRKLMPKDQQKIFRIGEMIGKETFEAGMHISIKEIERCIMGGILNHYILNVSNNPRTLLNVLALSQATLTTLSEKFGLGLATRAFKKLQRYDPSNSRPMIKKRAKGSTPKRLSEANDWSTPYDDKSLDRYEVAPRRPFSHALANEVLPPNRIVY